VSTFAIPLRGATFVISCNLAAAASIPVDALPVEEVGEEEEEEPEN